MQETTKHTIRRYLAVPSRVASGIYDRLRGDAKRSRAYEKKVKQVIEQIAAADTIDSKAFKPLGKLAIWGDIPDITSASLADLAIESLSAIEGYDRAQGEVKVVRRIEGSYNRVNVVQFLSGMKYCIRIPAASGRVGRWTKECGKLLEGDIRTMRYIKASTGLTMPDVLAYDVTCKNTLGYPYTITSFIQGKCMYELWEDDGSPGLEQRRQMMLGNLAKELSKLRLISWPSGQGTLDFTDPRNPVPGIALDATEGVYPWNTAFDTHSIVKLVKKPSIPFVEYRRVLLEHFVKVDPEWERKEELDTWHDGAQDLLNICIHALPDGRKFEADDRETASKNDKDWLDPPQDLLKDLPHTRTTLAPPDFEIQNILFDDDCNATDLIDWDGVQAVPSYRGWARYPKFLYSDWSYKCDNQMSYNTDALELARYRKDYARYMIEAMGGEGDCLYTSKSHLYCALYEALRWNLRRQDFIDKILGIVFPRADPVLVLERMTIGGERKLCPTEWKLLWDRLQQLFEPVAGPDERFSF